MSLPTPPGTAHRESKENRLPQCSSETRVAWSEHNEYHTLQTTPTHRASVESSSSKKLPTKSILKKTVLAALLPSTQENRRETTPEPEDPLADLHYLESPVARILATNAALRDLIEAYSILAARIRSCVSGNADADASWPLFQPIRSNSEAFANAVARDLGRALEDPLLAKVLPEPEPTKEEVEEDIPALPSPKSPKKKRGMSEEQVKHARDLCTTCHAVLKLLSAVFTLPALYQIFTDEQLRYMLTCVLAIPLANELPTPNARKTCALAIWLIQVQRLPEEILEPAKDRIAYALRRGIEGELGKEGKKGSVSDGLKAIHDLSAHYPSIFVPAFTDLLPSILPSLLAPTLAMRAQACHALGGLALGSASLPISDFHIRIAEHIASYLITTSLTTPSKKSPCDDSPIVRTLRTTLKAPAPQHPVQGPVWGLCVLANFVVLLKSSVFLNEKVSKCMTALFSVAMRHPKSSVRGLACAVWRSMTWAYFQPLPEITSSGQDEGTDVEMACDSLEDAKKNKQLISAWRLVSSVTDMGAGTSTIASLLATSSADESALRRALGLLKTMSKKGGPTCKDALETACHLVSLEHSEDDWNFLRLLPPSLFSSNPGLLTSDWNRLSAAVKPIFAELPHPEEMRSLTREELSIDWVFNSLLDVWKEGVKALRMTWEQRTVPDEISETWKGLLKGSVKGFKEAEDAEGLSRFAMKAVNILVTILEDPEVDPSSKPEEHGMDDILPSSPVSLSRSTSHVRRTMSSSRLRLALKLVLLHELWITLRDIFPSSSLTDAAEYFLAYMCTKEIVLVGHFHYVDNVHRSWAVLCASVALACDIGELNNFWGGRGCPKRRWDWPAEHRKLVWNQFVQVWQDGTDASWESAVLLLGVPFRQSSSWDMSNEYFDAWNSFLQFTMDKALDYGVDAVSVIDQVALTISENHCPTYTLSTRVADLLLSHLDITDARQIPMDIFEFVCDALRQSYPPDDDSKVPAMWLLRTITRIIDGCPLELSASMLETIQDGLSLWIMDKYEVLSLEDYSLDVLPLYQTILLGIQSLPASLDTLELLSPLLQSVFEGRKDKPEGATEAFQDFWKATYVAMSEPSEGWPEKIALCLEVLRGDDTEADALVHEPEDDSLDNDEVAAQLEYPDSDEEMASPPSTPKLRPVTLDAPFALRLTPSGTRDEPIELPTTPVSSPCIAVPSRPHKTAEFIQLSPSILSSSDTPPSSPRGQQPSTPRRTPRSGTTSSVRVRSSNKENTSPLPVFTSIAERIAARSPVSSSIILGKRRYPHGEEEEEDTGKRSKKDVSQGFGNQFSFPATDNDVTTPAPLEPQVHISPSLPSQLGQHVEEPEDAPSVEAALVVNFRKRKGVFLDAVELPYRRETRRRTESLPISSCAESSTSSSSKLSQSALRRTRSATKLLGSEASFARLTYEPKKRRRTSSLKTSGTSGMDALPIPSSSSSSYPMSSSSPLRTLREAQIANSDDSIMLATPTKRNLSSDFSSDDDPHLGQVTPHRLVSPAMRRIQDELDSDPPSDDSNMSTSPSRERIDRRERKSLNTGLGSATKVQPIQLTRPRRLSGLSYEHHG